MADKSAKFLDEITKQAMRERGLLTEFPDEVLNELETIDSPDFCPIFKDLRHVPFFSLDNEDSKDLDQLTFAEDNKNGSYTIYVAIADVDGLVPKGSACDKYARHNTTSIYMPTRIFPMLPLKLSNNLTSLNEQQDRCAIVVKMVVHEEGSIKHSEIMVARVHNHEKLDYDEVSKFLDGDLNPTYIKKKEIQDQIYLHDEIAKKMKNYRKAQGMLSFQVAEIEPVIINGEVRSLAERVPTKAHRIIEFFMISANATVTKFLTEKNIPTLRRVVRTPKNWDRIVTLAKEYGEELPTTPDNKALEQFLVKRRKENSENYSDLSLSIIKLLGKGEYVAEVPGSKPLGHFDLGLTLYAHTTAPNRRYPDLIMQRLLKAYLLKKPSPYTLLELEAIAKNCTEQEDAVSKVLRRVRKSAAAMILSNHLNETFDAIITGSSEKGVWVRIYPLKIEGRLLNGNPQLKVGDHLKVKLTYVDARNGFIDFVQV